MKMTRHNERKKLTKHDLLFNHEGVSGRSILFEQLNTESLCIDARPSSGIDVLLKSRDGSSEDSATNICQVEVRRPLTWPKRKSNHPSH